MIVLFLVGMALALLDLPTTRLALSYCQERRGSTMGSWTYKDVLDGLDETTTGTSTNPGADGTTMGTWTSTMDVWYGAAWLMTSVACMVAAAWCVYRVYRFTRHPDDTHPLLRALHAHAIDATEETHPADVQGNAHWHRVARHIDAEVRAYAETAALGRQHILLTPSWLIHVSVFQVHLARQQDASLTYVVLGGSVSMMRSFRASVGLSGRMRSRGHPSHPRVPPTWPRRRMRGVMHRSWLSR